MILRLTKFVMFFVMSVFNNILSRPYINKKYFVRTLHQACIYLSVHSYE